MYELHVSAVAWAGADGHPQRVADQRSAHVRGELPADHAAAVDIDHEREEQQAFPAAQVGEVGDVEPIRARGGELALDQIGPPGSVGIGRGGAPGLAAALGPADAGLAHQPLDPVAPDIFDAGASEREVHLAVAVGAEVVLVQSTDRRQQLLIADRACRTAAARALIVRRARHPERATDELDGEASRLLGFDEGAHLRGVPSSSFAKYTLAARRISLALRSSRTSRSSSFRRSRSALERTVGVPPAASALAWRTHVRSASLCTPRSCAICAIGRPDSSANRVARSRNSSLYFFGGCPGSRRTLSGGPPASSARAASVTGANQVREDRRNRHGKGTRAEGRHGCGGC